jgi:transcriptional regulator with XRE-family HTH domain
MAITRKNRLTPQDIEEVVTAYGFTLAQVARESGVDRIALSKFRNHGQALKLEDSRALLEWMQKNEIWEDADEPAASRFAGLKEVRFVFPVAGDVPDDVVTKVEELIEQGDARVATLFRSIVERNDGFLGDGHFTEDFSAKLQEAFAILASHYVLLRKLRGWPAFGVKPDAEDPETLRDVLFNTFNQVMVDAGLIAAPQISDGEGKDGVAAESSETEEAV